MSKVTLEQLAKHLQTGNLIHKRFSICCFNLNEYPSTGFTTVNNIPNCAEVGCAIGELPLLDPSTFMFDINGKLTLIGSLLGITVLAGVTRYFNITWDVCAHLFVPFHQKPELFSGQVLDANATRYEVAYNIEQYLQYIRQK